MSNFKLNIFTPNGIVTKDMGCESLSIPTTTGMINVLPGHTHIISEVSTGTLTAKGNTGEKHFVMTAGVVKVLGNTINVLSTTSEKKEDIDVERAGAALAKAELALSGKDALSNDDMIKFGRKAERAIARISTAKLK